MIRLRLERTPESSEGFNGILWSEEGKPVGRLIIEQDIDESPLNENWVPVEVIDET